MANPPDEGGQAPHPEARAKKRRKLPPPEGEERQGGGRPPPAPAVEKKSARDKAIDKELRGRVKKYERGPKVTLKGMKDKKLRRQLGHSEKVFEEAAITAAKVEQWLLPSGAGYVEAEGIERTPAFQQQAIVQELPLAAARAAFDLRLTDLGPYRLDYSRNGRFMLLAGRKGHLAMLDWRRAHIVKELQVKETVRDVKFLHNETFFAVAQKKYTYIYDKRGIEIHCLKGHREVHAMEFLPHHFLLATVGAGGVLQYQDTSTGQALAPLKTRLGRCAVMAANPANAILHLGHGNGTVTLWSPNMSAPLASLLAHRGPVVGVAIEQSGARMVTAGMDGRVKVWDLRTYKEAHWYHAPSPPAALALSQKGLLAVGCGSGVQIWGADALSSRAAGPYLTHRLPGGAAVEAARFCPYEDVLGVGHAAGLSSLVAPGAGEPNFDTRVANPFETVKQRREAEVAALLGKLRPDMIVLEPARVGTVVRGAREVQQEQARTAVEANRAARREKAKQKGRSRPSRLHKKKQSNIVDERRPLIRRQNREEAQKGRAAKPVEAEAAEISPALAPFSRKGRKG